MPETADRIESLFAAHVALPPEERGAHVERVCPGGPALRDRVLALFKAHDCAGHVIDQPVNDDSDQSAGNAPTGEQPGNIVAGRYKLLEEIGERGMGTVWSAEQTTPVRRKVALKLIRAGMDSRAALARFEAGRQALAHMDHPNIAKVLDGGLTDSGRPYFVMEFVNGVPITDYCDATRRNAQGRLILFVQVCSALQHAHQKGIIHRDLKPSNILVAPYDDKPVPKVIDFGLAKAMHQSLSEKSLCTAHEMALGTPLCMSPEQGQLNNLDIGTRTDIYSPGVLLYELLTGTTPIERKRFSPAVWDEVRRLTCEEEPPRPSMRPSLTDTLPSLGTFRHTEPAKLKKLVRGELDWIAITALKKDRTRRYETASGLARDIQRYLDDEVVEARPPSTGYRLRKFVRRHKAQVIAAGFVLLALPAGIAGTTRGLITEARAKTRLAESLVREQKANTDRSAANAKVQARYDLAVDAIKTFHTGALVSTKELAVIVHREGGQVGLQHSVEFGGSVARERSNRTLQHPQSGQQPARCDSTIPFRLATAQLHQQPLEGLRLCIATPLQRPDRRTRPQRQHQFDQQPMAMALQPAFQLPTGTLDELVKSLDPPPEVVPSSDRCRIAQGHQHVGQQQPTCQDASLRVADLGDDQSQRQRWSGNFDLLACNIAFVWPVQHKLGRGDVQTRRPTAISRQPSILERVFLAQPLGDRDQPRLLPGAEDFAIVGADHCQVSVGAPLPPMIDRICLPVDHMDQGRAELQAADQAHGLANLIDVAEVACRCIVARTEHPLGRGQRDQRRGDRGAIVPMHHQGGGEVVAKVFSMGQLNSVGFGCVPAKAKRRPIVDREEDARTAGDLSPNQIVHRLDQGENLDARVCAEPPQFLRERSRLHASYRRTGARRGPRAGFPEPLEEYLVSVAKRGFQPRGDETIQSILTHRASFIETNAHRSERRLFAQGRAVQCSSQSAFEVGVGFLRQAERAPG